LKGKKEAPMKNTLAILFLTTAIALPSMHALATAPERTAGENAQPAPAYDTQNLAGFTMKERQAIYDYYDMPPFQRDIREDIRFRTHAGPDSLVNSRLSPGVPRNDLPVRLARKLNPPKPGTKTVAIDADLVMLDLSTLRIIDVVPNVIPQYIR
jgi:hypothetical protein